MSELILIGIDFSALPDSETFDCFLWADWGDLLNVVVAGWSRREGGSAGLYVALTYREGRVRGARDSERARNISCTTFPDHKSTDKKL